jgi:RNA polymerase sigma factor (TIGR02999 family)
MTVAAVTELLAAARTGDRDARDRAFALVYAELKRLAHAQLGRGPADTLSTTGLVHETWLKLDRAAALDVRDREHFFCLAARAMRQVLLDRARAAGAAKRPDGALRCTLDGDDALPFDAARHSPGELLDLDRALSSLASLDARLAEVAELHLFGGLEFAEIAALREQSERTVFRDWRKARAILAAALGPAT